MVQLSMEEARVLGVLIEKDLSTPEYYPLSLNAVTNACNQKSNRDPVMALVESDVYAAMQLLHEKGLAEETSRGARVEKYAHRVSAVWNLSRGESAVIAELLLRGPQTPGELRQRTERMHHFADLETTQRALDKLSTAEPEPFVVQLPRQPGTKEARWAQLFTETPETPHAAAAAPAAGLASRVDALEQEVASLREALNALRAQLGS